MGVRFACAFCAALLLFAPVFPASLFPGHAAKAQTPVFASQEAARAEQKVLFDRLREEPDNLDLMAEYARLSILLEDYEAAISTMERMLIYRQDLPQVRRELGVAYFNIGSYEAAELYLTQVLAQDDLPPAVRENVQAYLIEIDQRTQTNRFVYGNAGVGLIFSTNANLGPDVIESGLVPGGFLDPLDSGPTEDFGVRAFGSLVHDYDLQNANSDVWRTEFSTLGIRYFDVSEGNLTFARVRTGPRLSLNDEEFGPKIRPFLTLSHLSVDDASFYVQGGLGVEFQDTLSTFLSLFGHVSVEHRDVADRTIDGFDLFRAEASAGLAYIPTRDLTLRGTFIVEQEVADEFENTNTEIALRFSADYSYESGLSWVDSKWSTNGFLDFRGRIFPGDQLRLDLDEPRQDFDFSAGITQIFGITENLGIQADISTIVRRSNIQTFGLDNVTLGISALYRL
ncbi:MAG: hypothetical protein AAF415_05110 [Pseudomonadota bacterium]